MLDLTTVSVTPESLSCLTVEEQDELLELLEQERAQTALESLTEYVSQIEVPGAPVSDDDDEESFYPESVVPAAHHRLLLSLLQDLAEGRNKRLMVFMPPGSAKSTYASVVFPTWYLGRYRSKNVISASYGSDLARKFGRKCRQVARSAQYQAIFDCTLSSESSAADEWALTNSSEYMSGGIRSGMTGNRADGLIIDDPVKNRQEADSETVQKSTYEAYKDDLRTRLKPHGWQLIIQTRWNEGDLSGQLLPEDYAGESGPILCRDGFVWEVICIPAECESEDDPLGREIGEFLWKEYFIQSDLEKIKAADSRTWSALYQQRPAPDEGILFKREWFKWYDIPPDHYHTYGASDYAVTDDGGDYTVHLVGGVDAKADLYLLDMWRAQTESDVWIDGGLLPLIDQHKPLMWAEEQGQIIKSVGPFLTRAMREKNIHCAREQFTSATDKVSRARSFQALASSGRVYLPRNTPWVTDFLRELLTFPAGKNDDMVDTASLLSRLLDKMVGKVSPGPEKAAEDKWDKAFDALESDGGSWKTA